MRFIENEGNAAKQIEVGDIVISEKGSYLVAHADGAFPIRLLQIENMSQRNGFKDLQALNSEMYIERGENIIRIIKSKNLVIREV